MSVVSSERGFVSNFLELMNIASTVRYTDDYKKDIAEIASLGPSLPKLKLAKKLNVSTDDESAKKLHLSFKSIKPPRFNAMLDHIPISSTVYKTKTELISSVEELRGFEVGQIKLLIKGKVISDSSLLSSLESKDDSLSFMVMVSGKAVVTDSSAENTPVPSNQIPEVVEIESDTWTKIHEVLLEEQPQHAAVILDRLKKGWILSDK